MVGSLRRQLQELPQNNLVLTIVADKCKRCEGLMTSFDEGEFICILCGWVDYAEKIAKPIDGSVRKRGRPKGYSRKGNIRLD